MMKKKKSSKELERHSTKKLLELAGRAIKNEFYLEASWIFSVIFDRRIKRILEKYEGRQRVSGFTFEQSIKRFKHLLLTVNNNELAAGFDTALIDRIRQWKNQRNLMLKDMLEIRVSQARMERLSCDGVRLYKEFSKAIKSYKAANQNIHTQEAG